MDPATSGQSTSQPKSPSPSTFRFFEIYSSSLCPAPKNDDDSDKVLKESARTDSRDVYADLIIVFKYKQPAKGVSKQEYEKATVEAYKELLAKLTRVGLQYETRPNGNDTLFVFILCPWLVLKREATRTRYLSNPIFWSIHQPHFFFFLGGGEDDLADVKHPTLQYSITLAEHIAFKIGWQEFGSLIPPRQNNCCSLQKRAINRWIVLATRIVYDSSMISSLDYTMREVQAFIPNRMNMLRASFHYMTSRSTR
jgi:hypothetical protein